MKHAVSPLAFFDLDRTLVAENTGRLWVEHERREGTISSLQAARAMLWLGLYHLSLIDLDRHTVVESAHPSPLSAHNGFFGSRPFSATNAALEAAGLPPIDWAIPD